MSKSFNKSVKIVDKATHLFSEAINEIKKANVVLEKGIELDNKDLSRQHEIISEAEEKMMVLHREREEKKSKIKDNEELIEKMEAFIP